MEREQKAILENAGRGLGLRGPWEGEQNWYGGIVQQVARLEEEGGRFKIRLCRLEMRKSYRFARFLGSRRLLRLLGCRLGVTMERRGERKWRGGIVADLLGSIIMARAV